MVWPKIRWIRKMSFNKVARIWDEYYDYTFTGISIGTWAFGLTRKRSKKHWYEACRYEDLLPKDCKAAKYYEADDV